MRLIRELNPGIPIVVFTNYTEAQDAIVKAQCAWINPRTHSIFGENGVAIVQAAVEEARRLVAEAT